MINFSLRQLQYFVATVEHGGVSAAARACHVSQPSVSLAIAQLEAALGSALFRRQASRGVELTAAGKTELALTYELAIDAQMARCTLAELAPYALLPADHPLAAQASVSLAQLASQPLVLEDIPHTREYLLSLFWQQQLTPRIAQTVQSFEMQRGLVAHGYGVALSCTRPAGDCSYDGRAIACRPLTEALPAQRVVLAQAPGAEASPLVAAFVASAQAAD